jgi:hypothetical protein
LVQTCKQRKKKSIVLKLDFRKVFDTVSWDCIFKTLQNRGFDRKWLKWFHMLTKSAKTVIPLNGVPGPWIQIKRGLRQGDLLSPLIFILIVDILQKVIQRFSREGFLTHPIVHDQTCLVIQYADDTLIILQGCPDQARMLKEILEAFSSTTGLTKNYSKSTFVPINLSDEEQTQISNILGCPVASFPQTYLGIPISDTKLPKWAFHSLLHSLDSSLLYQGRFLRRTVVSNQIGALSHSISHFSLYQSPKMVLQGN